MGYMFQVLLDQVTCRNTESIHSSDKFALGGAVLTDSEAIGFTMPMMRINDGEKREFPDDLRLIFDGTSNEPRVGLVLQAWDIDENDSWTENRADIKKVSAAVGQAIKLVPGWGTAVGAAWDLISTTVYKTIDLFTSFDKNDELMNYTTWVNMEDLAPYVQSFKNVTVNFSRNDPTGYSDWDYSLYLTVVCQWTPPLIGSGPGASKEQLHLEPYQNVPSHTWMGVWKDEEVTVSVSQASKLGLLKVIVEEKGQETTTTEVWVSKLLIQMTATPPIGGSEGSTINLLDHLTASVVRHTSPGAKTSAFEVLAKSHGYLTEGTTPSVRFAVAVQQFGGDHLSLNKRASLEMYRLFQNNTLLGEALRYRRPTGALLYLSAEGGRDTMLYRS